MRTYAACIPFPGFSLGVRTDTTHLIGIDFAPASRLRRWHVPRPRGGGQLQAWRDDPRFIFTLPLAPAGTPFRNQVWQAMLAIPCGETRSYGDVAKALGSAPRAVGGACGANPYPVVVPCHRIVAASTSSTRAWAVLPTTPQAFCWTSNAGCWPTNVARQHPNSSSTAADEPP